MKNKNSKVTELKSNFRIGVISREQYWTGIENYLSIVRELGSHMEDKVEFLQINKKNITVSYKLDAINKIQLIIPENDLRTASFTILVNGNYENVLELILLEFFRVSSYFIDIGANIGFYSISSLAINSKIKCIAFEPNPKAKSVLDENVKLNDIDDLMVYEFALSNSSGVSDFYIPNFTGSGGGSFKDLHPEEGKPQRYKVEVRTLDELIEPDPTIDLIKLDVEGSEYQVLLGALNVINKSKPTIVIELLRKWMKPFNSEPQDVVKLLLDLGYECFAISNDSIFRINEISDSTLETNFIFCHQNNNNYKEILNRFYKL